MPEPIWLIMGLALIASVLGPALVEAVRPRPPNPIQPVPDHFLDAYERRLSELERLFEAQPREAAAAAGLLVDDLLRRMGQPEPARPRKEPSPEEPWRVLAYHLDKARVLIESARRQAAQVEPSGRPRVE